MPAERDFGSTLRAARERKGVALREIANRTKISVAVLEALERNDISRLPGGIFGRAFVRSYAAEVGLDPETTIRDFIAQFPHETVTAGHSTSQHADDAEDFESERKMASTVLWMVLVSVPLTGVVLYFTMSTRSAGALAMPEPASVSLPAPAPAPAPALIPAAPPATPVPAPAPPKSEPAVEQPPPAQPDRLTIGLSARSPVFVQVTVDGQKTIDRLLQPGERQTVEVARELVLTAGDASAIRLTLNGADARALGKSGEVVRARLTPSNFKEYLQTR